jgi:hypothetical protein
MGFNEAVHAHISSEFYVLLTEMVGARGKQAFIHAVQYYAGQRGRRMAQRAIADGSALDHPAFMQYNELVVTDDVVAADGDLVSLAPDYVLHITNCPWHDTFKALGRLEAGNVYCTYLDEALCRGFNPALDFRAEGNLNAGPYCVHKVMGTHYQDFPSLPAKEEYKRDYSYHCSHLYWSMAEVCGAIFGAGGQAVAAKVLEMVNRAYGSAMADVIAGAKYTNFNVG